MTRSKTNLSGQGSSKRSPTPRNRATIELTITEESQFTWHATPKGKAAIDIKGNVAASSEELVLETKDQGNMAGKVKSEGADKFSFTMLGAPPGESGLEFERQK